MQQELVVWLEGGRATGHKDLGIFVLGAKQHIANQWSVELKISLTSVC